MAIDSIDELRCHCCDRDLRAKAPVWTNWQLHEISPDRWIVVCQPCEEALELNEGK